MQNLAYEEFYGPRGVHAVFYFRPNIADRNTILATYTEDEYNFQSFPAVAGDFMIDAGGYVGSTAILYAQLYPESKIICIEPLPENLEIISKNIEANNLQDRIILLPRALWGNSTDLIKVFYRDESTVGAVHKFVGSAFPNYHETVSQNGAEAQAITLSEVINKYCANKVRLLKMDIEGAEYEALHSIAPIDLVKIQTMVGEYHNVSPQTETIPRTLLYGMVAHYFENVSLGEEVSTWGGFLFERKK